MKKQMRIIALVLSVVLAMSCLAACGQKNDTSAETTAPAGGESTARTEANVPLEYEPNNMDPSRCADNSTGSVVLEVNETLVRYDVNGVLQPAGAESWEISEDGLVYTFHLRDSKYSDGTPVVAADYANAMIRNLQPEIASGTATTYYVIKGGKDFNEGKITDPAEVGIRALDEKTLEITLEEPIPYFIQMVNTPTLVPVPMDLTEGEANITYGSDISKMRFSGPFFISQWDRGSRIVLTKNPHYWDAENVKLETVNFLLAEEENTRQQMFEQGEVDVLQKVKQEYQDKIQGDIDSGKFTLTEMSQPRNSYICFNNQDPEGIFTNNKVRLAFSLAIDREEFVEKVMKRNMAAYSYVPPATNNGEKKYRDMVEEPLKAVIGTIDPKALLDEGLAEIGKKAEDVTITFLQSNANNDTKVNSEYFQNVWQNTLGVTVKLETAADNATFNTTVSKGYYQVCNTGWGADYNDPMTFMQMYTTGDGANAPFASNERYDELVLSCKSEMDMDVRAEKFAEAEKIAVVDECFLAPLYYTFAKNLSNSSLKNFAFNSAGGPAVELKNAYFE